MLEQDTELGVATGQVVEIDGARIAHGLQDASHLLVRSQGFDRSMAIPQGAPEETGADAQIARQPGIIRMTLTRMRSKSRAA
jgi:hypothetical protein